VRILYLNPIGGIGGAERVLLTAVAGVRRTEPSATIRVLTFTDGPLLPPVRDLGAEVEVVPMPAALRGLGDSQLRSAKRWGGRLGLLGRATLVVPVGCGYAARLRKAVSRFGPDVVHSNGIKTHLLSRVAVPRGVPVVWHLHDFYSLRPMAARLLRRMRVRVRTAIAISQAVAADTERVLPGVPIAVVPNAVDLTRFRPGPADDLDQLAGLPPAENGTVRVGLVATYARWKGQLTFLDAAKTLNLTAPELKIRWYIIGGPIYHTAAQFTADELRRAAIDRGIADRVGFVPFRQDPVGVYCGLDVVVHASTLPEPFGLTVAEAMACGRAVIVSNAGGAAELFTDGFDGLGVAPGDSGDLADAIRKLADDPLARVKLGINARTTAEARFDDSRYGPQLMEVYRRVVGAGPPGSSLQSDG
jgi:glycosyltransferase involved in cell wall biosynthesis